MKCYTTNETDSRCEIRAENGLILGIARKARDGWRFYPRFQRRPSRKGWPSLQKALTNYGIKL